MQDFELYPLELLANAYDLIMIDHPHIGTAVDEGLLIPLDDRLSEPFLRDQQMNSVGQSFASYTWKGHQWALAVDAAAQVGAYREDICKQTGQGVPQTWEDVILLSKALPEGKYIGMPLVPVHAFASFYTLCSQIGNAEFWSDGSDLAEEVGEQALTLLQEMLPILHPESVHLDPIGMSERMAHTDEIAYVPLMYGYSNYARDGFAPHVIKFTDIPSNTGQPSGSMIGGVGLAISARCQYLDLATHFVELTSSSEFQRTAFFINGGQPGHREAWNDDEVNQMSNDFFAETLRTLDLGSMRPRFNGYIAFQEQAGNLIRDFLLAEKDGRKEFVQHLNELFQSSCLNRTE
ncbi:Bacterial extracellular solute-binding protein [compost metagenome]